MKDMISDRLASLSREIDTLAQEQELLRKRSLDIDIRMHQLVGAVYELQQLLKRLDYQASLPPDPSEDALSYRKDL